MTTKKTFPVQGPVRSGQKGRKLPLKILKSRLGFMYENPVKWAIRGYLDVSDYIAGDDRIMKFVFQ